MTVQFPAETQSLQRHARGSLSEDDFPRPGEDVTADDKKGNLAKPSGFDGGSFRAISMFCTNRAFYP